jgi:hypothetical protein
MDRKALQGPAAATYPSRSRQRTVTLDLSLLRLHHAEPGKCPLGILIEPLHPGSQQVLVNAQIARRLRDGHAPFLDQPHRLDLELSRVLTSFHALPPVSS